MTVRVYVPLTRADVAVLAQGALPGPRVGHAVTPALTRAWAGADEEDLEYAASMAAGLEAVDADRRRVAAFDVDEAAVAVGDGTRVTVAGDLTRSRLASLLVDVEDWSGDEDDDLAWFAPQEIDHLLD